ncbi:MAG: hypothetical protein KAR42_17745 [candidate division Zixibacteria bacterium]|nr:hypothetical protein [candidate division Zixibacteria bacterium]
MSLEDRARLVYNRMQVKCVGRDNTATPERININAYGATATEIKTPRVIRQHAYEIIAYIREHWDIVCEVNMGAGKKGYFIPETSDEAEEYLNRTGAGIGTRARNWNNQKAKAVQRFPELNNQLTLKI